MPRDRIDTAASVSFKRFYQVASCPPNTDARILASTNDEILICATKGTSNHVLHLFRTIEALQDFAGLNIQQMDLILVHAD